MKTQSLTKLAAGLVLVGSLFTAQADECKKKKSDCKECPSKTQSSKTESMEREIWAAAKAGKISKEEAMKKLSSLKGKQQAHGNHAKSDHAKGAHGDPRKAKYQTVEREIIAAVKAGKLSKEEAGKKLESMKKTLWSQAANKKGNTPKRISREQAEKMGRDIAAAVKAGKLSREEAHKKSQAIRKMAGAGQSDHPNHHHQSAHNDRRGNDRNLAGEVDALRREIHELKRALEATRRHHGDRRER